MTGLGRCACFARPQQVIQKTTCGKTTVFFSKKTNLHLNWNFSTAYYDCMIMVKNKSKHHALSTTY